MAKKTPRIVRKPNAILNLTWSLKQLKIHTTLVKELEINIIPFVPHLDDSRILEKLNEIYKRVLLLNMFL